VYGALVIIVIENALEGPGKRVSEALESDLRHTIE
jgi:hypothetical protein